MTPDWSVAFAATVVLACGSVAQAQTCVGQPSLNEVHFNAGANMRNVSQGRGFEGRASFGNARAFGSASFGRITYDKGSETHSYISNAAAGLSKTLGTSGGICPIVAVEYENGPENIVIDHTELSSLVGLSVGGVARLSETVGLVSFVGGGYQWIRSNSKLFDRPESTSSTENGIAGTGGLGLLFKQQYLVRASVHIPAGSLLVFKPSVNNFEGGSRPVYFVLGFSFAPSGAR